MAIRVFWASVLMAIMVPGLAFSGSGEGAPSLSDSPDGMFVLSPVLERSCIAVKVPLGATEALSGLRWFNNDDQTVFPKVLVASGYADIPPLYDDGVLVATNAGGGELDWSDIPFNQSLGSETGALYVIFQLPAFEEGEQQGVGPAFGYTSTDETSSVFVSQDGDNWTRMTTDYQLLVDPVYTIREPGMATLSCSQPSPGGGLFGPSEGVEDIPESFEDELLKPYPNPFNPTTRLSFTLKDGGLVDLEVFDVRGRKVLRLHTGFLEPGRHDFTWSGTDAEGQRVASGIYFARLKIEDDLQVQRMMLLK